MDFLFFSTLFYFVTAIYRGQERSLLEAGKYGGASAERTFFMPADADEPVRAFRKWYNSRGGGGPTWAQVRAILSGTGRNQRGHGYTPGIDYVCPLLVDIGCPRGWIYNVPRGWMMYATGDGFIMSTGDGL